MKFYAFLCCMFILASCSRSTLNFTTAIDDKRQAPAKFTFKVTENNYERYLWDFGDGTSIEDDSLVSHIYYLSGNYQVTLKAFKGKKYHTIHKELHVEAPEKCLIRIETPFGEMIAELFDDTPKHRDNFTKLTEEGYYDDLLFHRVIGGFMIQGGDPNSRNADPSVALGAGGPGYQIDAEFSKNRAHVKGAIAAARLGDAANPQKKSSGSQFYIVQGRKVSEASIDLSYPSEIREKYTELGGVPFLDQEYTVFGQVIQGLDVIDRIASANTNNQDRPLENITMKISLIK